MDNDRQSRLQEALTVLETWRARNASVKDRRCSRYGVRAEARLLPADARQPVDDAALVFVRDVSRGGAGVLSSQPAEIGTMWQMQFARGPLVLGTMTGTCRYCRSIEDLAWLIGIEFGAPSALMVALGVSADAMAANEAPAVAETIEGDFFEPKSGAA